MGREEDAPTLRVQTVLYESGPAELRRWATGVVRAAGVVRPGVSWSVAVGDCSPHPCIGAEDVEAVTDLLRDAGAREAHYTPFGRNLGHGGGQNALLEGSVENLLLILNPDCVASPWMMERLIAALFSDPRLGAADCRQLPLEHPKAYDPVTGATSWVSGACCLFRTAAFREVSGFDDQNFPLYADDVDLSWRLRLQGWQLRHVPSATSFHDKRLNSDGTPVVSRVEVTSSAAAWLMIMHRFSHPQGLNHWRHFLSSSNDPEIRAVVDEFARRQADGDLPEAVDPDHQVAEFNGATFGTYRW